MLHITGLTGLSATLMDVCVCTRMAVFYFNLWHALPASTDKPLQETELSMSGRNWGDAVIDGSTLVFTVAGKPAFRIPLTDVGQVCTSLLTKTCTPYSWKCWHMRCHWFLAKPTRNND